MFTRKIKAPLPTDGTVKSENAKRILGFLADYAEWGINSRLIDERRTIPPQIILDFAEAGVFGLQIEKAYGGQELSYSEFFRVMEILSAIDSNVALLVGVHNSIGIPPIRFFSRPEVREEVLPQLASGRSLAGIASSEPGAGSNLRGIKAEARKQPSGGYILNGEKSWISLGSWAKYISVFAMLKDVDGKDQGFTGFLVERSNSGWIAGDEALTYGMRGLPQNHVRMENLALEENAILGDPGKGEEAAQEAFMLGRTGIGANSLGTMKRVMQVISRYAERRPVATGMLLDNGFTHQILTDCAAGCRATELFVFYIADLLDKKKKVPTELHIFCKIVSSEFLWKVIDRGVQMLGARGFLDTNVVGLFHRDSRLLRIFEGPTEAMLLYLGQGIMKDEHTFLNMLNTQFGLSDISGRLENIFSYFRAKFSSSRIDFNSKENFHVHAAALGQIACWGVLAAVVRKMAHGSSSEFDQYVSLWASRKLDQVIFETRNDFRPKSELPSADMLRYQIESYGDTIGCIEKFMGDEARAIDPLIHRDMRTEFAEEENIPDVVTESADESLVVTAS